MNHGIAFTMYVPIKNEKKWNKSVLIQKNFQGPLGDQSQCRAVHIVSHSSY